MFTFILRFPPFSAFSHKAQVECEQICWLRSVMHFLKIKTNSKLGANLQSKSTTKMFSWLILIIGSTQNIRILKIEDEYFLNPIYHDIFSNWFSIRVLIIKISKIIDIANLFDIFYNLSAWSNCWANHCSLRGSVFKFLYRKYIFSKKGEFQQLKMLASSSSKSWYWSSTPTW